MRVLALRTDGPHTFIALYEGDKAIAETHWESGKELARDLLGQISSLLESQKWSIDQLDGLACFAGPGSFTSLRIGVTTMNTLAYAKSIPIVSAMGEAWVQECLHRLSKGESERIVLPVNGSDPHITEQKK